MKKKLQGSLAQDIGENIARITEPAIAMLAAIGLPDERCRACTFRAGSLSNGCLNTVLDAIKCVMEGHRIECRDGRRTGETCHGWLAARVDLNSEKTETTRELHADYSAGNEGLR